MRDDITPTNPQPVDVSALSEANGAYIGAGNLAEDERVLRDALAADAADERAAAQLTEQLTVAGRYAEAVMVLEAELSALADRAASGDAPANGTGPDPMTARRAQRHRLAAQLWDENLARLDRAIHHWQAAWELAPDRGEALEAARQIYASVGDDMMVGRLYEAELEVLGERGPRPRRGHLELCLGALKATKGDAMAAANHLEIALRLDPDSQAAREKLAEVYASPAFAEKADRRRRAGELFVALAQRSIEAGEHDAAIRYLRRALGVDPDSAAAADGLERALSTAARVDELLRLYQRRGEAADTEEERIAFLEKRVRLYQEQGPGSSADPASGSRQGTGEPTDREALKVCLEELCAMRPASGHGDTLRALCREDDDWDRLARLIERDIEALNGDPRIIDELLELALICREHLGDRDRAAELLHRVLSLQPGHPEALARYADHFRDRRDWRGLADLTEFAANGAAEAGAPPADQIRRLEELADICEMRLGDIDRAVATWRRIEILAPDSAKVREAQRRLSSRSKMWQSLVGVLESEAEAAQTQAQRAEALRRIAQTYRERQVNPRRAIALFEEVWGMFPNDESILKALIELYEREGDDAGVASALRRQLDLEARRLATELSTQGRAMTAREWPVARRVERLTALRRLASMYEQQLADVEGVVFACSGILEVLPGDRDALARMERVLETAGDLGRLEQTLEYHAASATGPAERSRVLSRLARLAVDRGDEVVAMERWEKVLGAAPNDAAALAALSDLYFRHKRWPELAAVLERSLMSTPTPAPGSPAAAEHAAALKRYARTVDQELGDGVRATRGWCKVLESSPRDRDALTALATLYEAHGQWRNLAEILARQAPLFLDEDPDKAAAIALMRAQLLEERLGAPIEAVRALEWVLTDIDPANLDAHAGLRRLYMARGDFDSAVRIAERELYLASEPATEIALAVEIGHLCRDRLRDPHRAIMAFERALDIDPEHAEALACAGELYDEVGDIDRHVAALERQVALAGGGAEAQEMMLRMAAIIADRLGDEQTAFAWYRRAYDAAPQGPVIAEIRRAAEAHERWQDLCAIYDAERDRLLEVGAGNPADGEAYSAACREIAVIAERKLGDLERAMKALYDAIAIAPRSEDLVSEAERIAGAADDPALWELFLTCLEPPLAAAGRAGRVAIHRRRARVREDRLGDRPGAAEELLKAFSYAPEREEIRRELCELAERGGSWADVVAVDAALIGRAARLGNRLELLRRKADVLENRMGEKARAFRVHLVTLFLSPDDATTIAHLWRLGRDIGTYAEADRTPAPEPPAAHIEVRDPSTELRALARGPRSSGAGDKAAPIRVEATRRHSREATQELSIADLMLPGDANTAPLSRMDKTMPLDISDLLPAQEGSLSVGDRSDPTIELRTEDLIHALGGRSAPAPAAPNDRHTPVRPKKGPPPPPRSPRIARRPAAAPPPVAPRPPARSGDVVPVRAYATPWEELATAYEALPATGRREKRGWLYRAAEVWESGAADIARAFDCLARALELVPDDPEPRDRLYRLASDHGAWDRLAALYESAAEEADTAVAAASLLLDVAAIRNEQGKERDTEAIYRRILGMRPDDAVARERLETLYRKSHRWVDLAASLEERTDPRLGAAAPAAERPALLRELAAIYRKELGRPHDAIDALERLRELAPSDVEVLQQLADLSEEIGRWSQVVAALSRIVDASEGKPRARDALRRIGEIYEHKLELPDRAIDAYAQLAGEWPNDDAAHEALDRLYEAHAQWRELSETLKRRASLARDPGTRAALLVRRAKVLLDWLDSPEEAATVLRHARTLAQGDDDIINELVRALCAAERQSEAAAVLEGRIQAKKGDATDGTMAALLVRLASIRGDHLDDIEGARRALDRALSLVPDHPTALAMLARLAEVQDNPRGFAEAKLREARAVTDPDAKISALLAAGAALRDHVDDIDGARAAFEEVLALRPYHAEATWSLAGLVEQGGNLDSAAQLLEQRLAHETLSVEERARTFTQLAALSRQAGAIAAAEHHLDEALATHPTYLPAVIAYADLLASSERWDDASTFLLAANERLEEAPKAARAELQRRLAKTYEKLGREDDAYQILLEADRLHRHDLAIKLALGENRYRARRWREAALHLSGLASHADAESQPAEVAEGLYHAALAEIRSLRPEKAEPLYERALELKASYAPALSALAELAIERGDTARAADLLGRQAAATDNPSERMRLYEALGDMALYSLNDEARAKDCYEQAVAAADPLEAHHMELLGKLLERQDLAGDHAGGGRTAELMASFAGDPRARAARLCAAAGSYRTAGDSERARAAADRAVDAAPDDHEAVAIASELAMAAGDHEAAAAILGRALSGNTEPDEITAPRHALLWARLGEARLRRGDEAGASTAFSRAVATAPESDGAMAARRQLIDLSGTGDHDTTVEHRRAIAADSLDGGDIIAYARALASSDGLGGRHLLELSMVLDQALSDSDRAFLDAHPHRDPDPDEAYHGVIERAARAEVISDDDDHPLAEILASLWEAAPLLWSEPKDALERCGVAGATRVPGKTSLAAAPMFTRIARALDAPATVLYATEDTLQDDVRVVCVSPPIVVLGPRAQGIGDDLPTPRELRFMLGRAAELCRPERIVAAGLPEEDLAEIVSSVVRVFGDPQKAPASSLDPEVAAARDELLRQALPVKVRTRLGDLVRAADAGGLEVSRYLAACRRAADRAGALVAGDIGVAMTWASETDASGRARHLIDMCVSAGFCHALHTLWG